MQHDLVTVVLYVRLAIKYLLYQRACILTITDDVVSVDMM